VAFELDQLCILRDVSRFLRFLVEIPWHWTCVIIWRAGHMDQRDTDQVESADFRVRPFSANESEAAECCIKQIERAAALISCPSELAVCACSYSSSPSISVCKSGTLCRTASFNLGFSAGCGAET